MSGVKSGNVVKRSVSFSETVNEWAEELAKARGFETNFSGFCADLIRRAKEAEAASLVQQLADAA